MIFVEPHPPLSINTTQDLQKHEEEILRRISAIPSGGELFMLNPLLLLADLQVEMGAELKTQIVAKIPELANLPSAPYTTLKASNSRRPWLRIRVSGLFR
jgi:hypothetical protein